MALALSLTLPGAVAWSADADTADHTAHHPAGAASAPKSAPVQKTTAKPGAAKAMQVPVDKGAMEKMGQMDTRMKAMQDMHQKLMAAKTAEERNALMPEQMKIMQEAMAAMEGMRGGKGGMGMMGGMEKGQMMDRMPPDMMMHQMMEKRMDMMQSMMQMMMDRMAPPAAK
ncbi:MAG: hypothetical protein A3F78_12840 [Burkholderiales bacterium RIFCSPLOWO2_12_FULL_61_40]|nr:MAG: hypothetical protein A3F78_12840 [Burkholderiales bacterium RIFCSPLOWO2_12_FULL_61_40]